MCGRFYPVVLGGLALISPNPLNLKGFYMQTSIVSFHGRRHNHATLVEIVEGPRTRDLPLHLAVRNHSPCGFEWGYLGSGPAQLALAMCIELVGPVRAERVYQHVKERLIARLIGDDWSLSGDDVRLAIETAEAAA